MCHENHPHPLVTIEDSITGITCVTLSLITSLSSLDEELDVSEKYFFFLLHGGDGEGDEMEDLELIGFEIR